MWCAVNLNLCLLKHDSFFQLHFLTKNYSQKSQGDQRPASDIYRFLKTIPSFNIMENSRCQTYVLVDENYGNVVTAGESLESFFYVGDARVYTRLNITSHRLRNDLQCILRREGHKPLLTHSLTSRKGITLHASCQTAQLGQCVKHHSVGPVVKQGRNSCSSLQ